MSFSTWLESTGLSNWLRYSAYPYPIFIMIHVLAIAIFGGVVVIGNLRILGYAMTDTPASEVLAQFRPWKWAGFAVFLITGIILSISDPVEYYTNPMYWLSLVLLLAAAVNAWVFHHGAERTIVTWDAETSGPRNAKVWAITSLVLWTAMVGVGRAIAFF